MIGFGSALSWPEAYDRYAKPGISRVAEHDSEILAYQSGGSTATTYNLVLDHLAVHDDLEAVVLVDQNAEITDPEFCSKVRQVLADPDVAVAGCVGSIGATSIAWWEGEVRGGSAVFRYGDWGGGEMPVSAWNGGPSIAPPGQAAISTGEVDTVFGFVMVLSPWAVQELRFDEALGQTHGFDFDYCQQVRAQRRKVVTADLAVAYHQGLRLIANNEAWVASHMRVAEKWDGAMPGATAPSTDWRGRARRTEAEAAVARLAVASRELQRDARAGQDQRALTRVAHSLSWRLTEPLRWLNRLRRRRASKA